jgi:hypothetical protein
MKVEKFKYLFLILGNCGEFWRFFKENFPLFLIFKEGICVQQNIVFPKTFKQNGEKFATKKNTGTRSFAEIKTPPRQFDLRTVVLSRPATCSDVHAF